MSGNFQGLAMGVAGILGGALVLIVGLNMSDIVISSINETGARIACYSGEGDIPIDNARFAPTLAASTTGQNGTKIPTSGEFQTSASFPGGARDIIGRPCGGDGVTFSTGTDAGTATAVTAATHSARDIGTVRYQLEVYGATGLNNIFSLLYFIVLVMIALGMVGGGAMIARDSVRGMSG